MPDRVFLYFVIFFTRLYCKVLVINKLHEIN